jgi:hypothetical protein
MEFPFVFPVWRILEKPPWPGLARLVRQVPFLMRSEVIYEKARFVKNLLYTGPDLKVLLVRSNCERNNMEDIKHLSQLAFKGDEEAQAKLLEIGEDALETNDFELASNCFREAALAYKWQKYKTTVELEAAVAKLGWEAAKGVLLKDYSNNHEQQKAYSHSFPTRSHARKMLHTFIHEQGDDYCTSLTYFEVLLEGNGVEFSYPGNSPTRYQEVNVCTALGFEAKQPYDYWTDNPDVRIALDGFITGFLEWAKERTWGEGPH